MFEQSAEQWSTIASVAFGIIALQYTKAIQPYDEHGNLKFDQRYFDQYGNYKYPPYNGFKGGKCNLCYLKENELIDRYGGTKGKFASPAGTPYNQRALPVDSNKYAIKKYKVLKPILVYKGTVEPWFFEQGGGTQYMFEKSIQYYLDNGYLEEYIG